MSTSTIRISEIFGPTIQGEGALIGHPTIFVRTGGCDYRCSWCDTLYAVESKYRHDWTPMSAEQIMEKVDNLSGGNPMLITLSGGNPATQDCQSLIELGHEKGYRFAIETQGSISQDWFSSLDNLTLSPKPPSSDMDTDWNKLDKCVKAAGPQTQISLKIVIADKTDYQYARTVSDRYPDLPIYLQPCNPAPGDAQITAETLSQQMRDLIDQTHQDGWFKPIILPQLHVYLWGNERGV